MSHLRTQICAFLVGIAVLGWVGLLLFDSGSASNIGHSAATEAPTSTGNDPVEPLANLLRRWPQVATVRVVVEAAAPEHTILHVRNWHLVSKELFIADLRDADPNLAVPAVEEAYAQHLDEVEAIQHEQLALLRRMIETIGIRVVHLEGLAETDLVAFAAKIKAIREIEEALPTLHADLEQLPGNADNKALRSTIESAILEHRADLLRIGAAGRLIVTGELIGALALEDPEAYRRARPLASGGRIVLDASAIEAREDAHVRVLLKGGPVSIVLLGGAHGLGDNVRRLGGGRVELIEIETTQYRSIAQQP